MAENDEERRKIDEQRKLFDAITKEWLDEKYRDFGRFTAKALLAFLFIFFIKAVFHLNAADLRSVLETATQAQSLAAGH